MFTAYECHSFVSFTFGWFYNLIALNSPGITTSTNKSLCTSLLVHDSKKHSCHWRIHALSIQKCSHPTTAKNICQLICIRRTRRGLGPPLLTKMEPSRLEPVALASPQALSHGLTAPPQGQELLDPVLRESAGKKIQKKSPKPSGNLQPVNTRNSEAPGPEWV